MTSRHRIYPSSHISMKNYYLTEKAKIRSHAHRSVKLRGRNVARHSTNFICHRSEDVSAGLGERGEHVARLRFDPSSNTGARTGAIIAFKRYFKNISIFACRHHILETTATAVFNLFFVLKGPITPVIRRFSENWPLIDQTQYKSQKHIGHLVVP